MCPVTSHTLGRHTFQNSSEQAGLSWKEPGSPNTSWIRKFRDSPVFFLNLYLFLSLYYFWIHVNEICLWLPKMDERLAWVRSFKVGFDGEKPIQDSLQRFLTLTPSWCEMGGGRRERWEEEEEEEEQDVLPSPHLHPDRRRGEGDLTGTCLGRDITLLPSHWPESRHGLTRAWDLAPLVRTASGMVSLWEGRSCLASYS